jgi:hypothetical protein
MFSLEKLGRLYPRERKFFSSVYKSVLEIRIRMFFGLQDPDSLVRDTDSDPDPSLFS